MPQPDRPEALRPPSPEFDNLEGQVSEYVLLISAENPELHNWAIFVARCQIDPEDKLDRLSRVYEDELMRKFSLAHQNSSDEVEMGRVSRFILWVADKFDK